MSLSLAHAHAHASTNSHAAGRQDVSHQTPRQHESRPATRAVPQGAEARGFVLYVGVDEADAEAAGTTLGSLVQALRTLTAERVPGAESYAAIALAPEGIGGRAIDVVRLALGEPSALAKHRDTLVDDADRASAGLVIDISRKRVVIDNAPASLTFKEFELLQYLVLREGQTVDRHEIIDALWDASSADDAPNERTIDVHVRRLRAKLGSYDEIVRTVRGVGYRFDRHADVTIRYAATPSPDRF